jgi:hypothetical protein
MLKKCKWYQFHKWEYVYDSYKNVFLDEECEVFYTKYRMCSKCNTVQSYDLL